MSVINADFLAVAETLVQTQSEIFWRSAVNRAYYAAYHTAVQSAVAMFGYVPNFARSAHREIIECFREHNKANIADSLDALRKQRTKADYMATKELTQGEAYSAIHKARYIMRLVNAL